MARLSILQHERHTLKHPSFFFLRLALSILWLAGGVFLSSGCDDDEKEARIQQKIEKTRAVLANHCTADRDCLVTGCHASLCRAMPEPDFCDNRLVVAIENEEDIGTVKQLVADQLTVSEGESLRIGGYAAGRWTVSFQGSWAQRLRVESALRDVPLSGFGRLHPATTAYTNALYEALAVDSPDVALRSMKGVGQLTEIDIRAGDILSKEDIRDAWEQIVPKLSVRISDTDEIERLWAYDVIFETVSKLRLWPIDKRQRIGVRQWKAFDVRYESGDIILTATLEGHFAATLKAWSQGEQIIVLLLGNEVLASAIPTATISDGRFDFVIHNAAHSSLMRQNLETLSKIAHLHGAIALDDEATAKVERDIACQKKYPRTCACLDGLCGWALNPDYNACLYP